MKRNDLNISGDRTVALPEIPDLSTLTPSDLAPILLTSAAVFAFRSAAKISIFNKGFQKQDDVLHLNKI